MTISEDIKKAVFERLRKGEKPSELSKKFGIKLTTVYSWRHKVRAEKPGKRKVKKGIPSLPKKEKVEEKLEPVFHYFWDRSAPWNIFQGSLIEVKENFVRGVIKTIDPAYAERRYKSYIFTCCSKEEPELSVREIDFFEAIDVIHKKGIVLLMKKGEPYQALFEKGEPYQALFEKVSPKEFQTVGFKFLDSNGEPHDTFYTYDGEIDES